MTKLEGAMVLVLQILVGCGSITPLKEGDGGAQGGRIGTDSGGARGEGGSSTGGELATGGAGGMVIGTGGISASTGGAGGSADGAAPIVSVELAERDLNATDAPIAPHFKIFNAGTTTIALSGLTVRYWYTEEGEDGMTLATSPIAQQASCDFAAVGCSNITMSFVPISPPLPGANFYFELGFTTGAGTLAAGANTNEIQVRFNKANLSNYNELDDYSYIATTAYVVTTKVTAYQNDQLVYGVEP